MTQDFRPLALDQVLDAIASARPSSGAGIAAALALALAVACAQKAVGVSLKHRDDAQLRDAAGRLDALRRQALRQGQLDATLFEAWLRDQQPREAALLVQAAEQFQHLSQQIADEIQGLTGRVVDTVVGDLSAARALQQAAGAIEAELLRENQRAQTQAPPQPAQHDLLGEDLSKKSVAGALELFDGDEA